jgi:pyridoxine 5-phosphate synthase
MTPLRLGLNIDHVATLRNARGEAYPDPVTAAHIAADCGVDSITAHLREDRRHMRDDDMRRLRDEISLPLNMEMAATAEMQKIALDLNPFAICLVPEKRNEVTTEGGLDVIGLQSHLQDYIRPFKALGCRVSLFIDPEEGQIEASRACGADAIELHTGAYCHDVQAGRDHTTVLTKITKAAKRASALGLEVHAGHGLCYQSVAPIAAIAEIEELNIGHFLIAQSVFVGLAGAVAEMQRLMVSARRS